MRRGIDQRADASLRSRRRAVEGAQLVSRTVGLLCTLLYMSGVTGYGPERLSDDMTLVCQLGLGLMTVANLLGLRNARRPGSLGYQPLSVVQVVFDTITIIAFVAVSERDFVQTTWPLLGLSISIAAIRHQLAGAILAYLATSVSYLLLVPDLTDAAFVLGIGAMTTIIAGSQSAAFARQLTTLQETRRALQHQATHDGLTGLPNRAHLDGFKQVNDTYGHAAGDRLLHEIGGRLTVAAGPGAVAGRLGGDEFLILLPGAGTAEVTATRERVREAVHRPVGLGDGVEVTVGVSVGVALRPAGGEAALDRLAAEADAAMYREKHDRKAA
jgi:diguanylate cyclase (GGDEF)-like protein